MCVGAVTCNYAKRWRAQNKLYDHERKIYRFWTEIKDTFTGRDRESILNECEFVEDAVLKAYAKAMEHEDLTVDLKKVIGRQYDTLLSSHLMINHYRDMALMNLYKV
ncbi:MAG: PA2169 family four-helix-bundle protein [Bacteroidota bacterium]